MSTCQLVMVHVKAEEAEQAIQKAVASIKDRTYQGINYVARELNISKGTLHQ